MSKFKKEIDEVKSLQDNLVKIQSKIRSIIVKMSKLVIPYLQHSFEKNFPGVKTQLWAGFEGGSFTDAWKPEVYLDNIDGAEHCRGKFYRIIANDLYLRWDEVKSPVSVRKLRNWLKTVSEETGIKVRLVDFVGLKYREEEDES
jgi:hypothetical protein